jgi:hypothetical protein
MEPVELIRELVYLRLGTTSGLLARIVQLDRDSLVLTTPVDEEGRQVTPAEATPVEIGWMTKDGIEWHTAVVRGPPSGDRSGIVVRLHEMRGAQAERRAFPRAKVALDCEVAAVGTEPVRGRIVDVGSGGIAVIVPLELEPGAFVQMTVPLDGEEPIRLTASCMRTSGEGPAGFTFGLFAAGTKDRLVEHAFRRAAEAA